MVLVVALDYRHSIYCIHHDASDHFGEFQRILGTRKLIQFLRQLDRETTYSSNQRRSGRLIRDAVDSPNRFGLAGMMISHSTGIFNAT